MSDIFDVFGDDEPDHHEEERPRKQARPRSAEHRSRTQRNRRVRTGVTLFVIFVVLGVVIMWLWPRVSNVISNATDGETSVSTEDFEGPGTGEVIVQIPAGASGSAMADVLVEEGVVKSNGAFVQAYNDNPRASSITPGWYRLQEGMPAADAVNGLLDAENRAELTMTIPEGFTKQQVYERIARVFDVPLEDVEAAAADTAAIGLPEEAGGNPEGWFAPLTYDFAPNATPTEVLTELVSYRVSSLEAMEVPRDRWQEVLTKGSIVEREVNIDEYYPMVARVIENRLVDTANVVGRLQMDSTVLYGVGKTGGVPTREDLDNDNPYNTYIHAGLPPSPIGVVGDRAIEAVMHPAEGDWLYFVTVNLDTGETLFAATLEEHNANKALFDQWLAENPQ